VSRCVQAAGKHTSSGRGVLPVACPADHADGARGTRFRHLFGTFASCESAGARPGAGAGPDGRPDSTTLRAAARALLPFAASSSTPQVRWNLGHLFYQTFTNDSPDLKSVLPLEQEVTRAQRMSHLNHAWPRTSGKIVKAASHGGQGDMLVLVPPVAGRSAKTAR